MYLYLNLGELPHILHKLNDLQNVHTLAKVFI